MAPRNNPSAAPTERTLLIERVFDAPRELVFQAWADERQAAQWWGPKGIDLVYVEMDVRPGGKWRKCMRSADGKHEYWRSGVYREVVAPERLVFTYFSDDPNSKPGHETLVTVTFEEHEAGRTKLTLHQAVFESAAARDSHRGGWTTTVERLAEYLAARLAQ
jgi:uncharacterized protein YndB with AHSA1/START domain